MNALRRTTITTATVPPSEPDPLTGAIDDVEVGGVALDVAPVASAVGVALAVEVAALTGVVATSLSLRSELSW